MAMATLDRLLLREQVGEELQDGIRLNPSSIGTWLGSIHSMFDWN